VSGSGRTRCGCARRRTVARRCWRTPLTVTPEEHVVNWQQDPFGNFGARLVFPEQTRQLSITVDLVADMTVINPFDFFVEEDAEHYPFSYAPGLERDLGPYLGTEEPGATWPSGWPPCRDRRRATRCVRSTSSST